MLAVATLTPAALATSVNVTMLIPSWGSPAADRVGGPDGSGDPPPPPERPWLHDGRSRWLHNRRLEGVLWGAAPGRPGGPRPALVRRHVTLQPPAMKLVIVESPNK